MTEDELVVGLRIARAVVMVEQGFEVLALYAHEMSPELGQHLLQLVEKYSEARRRVAMSLAILQPESQARN